MRCWRIMKGEAADQVGMMRTEGSKLELSFEYLMPSGNKVRSSVVGLQASNSVFEQKLELGCAIEFR